MSAVWFAALQQAAKDWFDQGDDLDGAKRALAKVEVDQLSEPVQAAARDFADHWSGYIHTLVNEANEHGSALNAAALQWWGSDRTNVEGLQNLLPWDQRNLTPQPINGFPSVTTPGGEEG